MYSHGSLHSQGIDVLQFIADSFEEVEGSQNYRYRKHGFVSKIFEEVVDAPPGKFLSLIPNFPKLIPPINV